MTLDIIKLQTTWNDAAGSINSNYAKIADAIAQLKANGGGGGGGADIDLTDYASKVWVEAKGYITASALTPYALKTDIPSLVGYATEDFVNNKLNAYTTTEDLAENYASKNDLETAINNIDLSPYLKTEDAEETYATKDFVNNKLVDYAPLTSVQGFENRIGGLEGAVPQLNARVTIVEGKVSSLNELVSTGENNLLDRVNTIETDYVTSGKLESAINGIDLSAYLLKADLTKSRIQSTLGISDWALAATKPSYAWSEITSRPTALSQFTDDVVAGKYLPLSGGNIVSDKELILYIISSSPNSYAMFYANGRNRASVGYYNGLGYIANEISYARIGVTDTGEPQYWDSYGTDANKYTLLHSGNIGNYNAGSATKLQTRSKLWGNNFDGTSDVNGHFVSTGENGGFALYSGIRHNEALSIERLSASGTWLGLGITLNLDGYVGIGNAYPAERLDVLGNIKASGNINATSVTIGGVTFSWDSVNNALVVNGNMYGTGSITAKKSA